MMMVAALAGSAMRIASKNFTWTAPFVSLLNTNLCRGASSHGVMLSAAKHLADEILRSAQDDDPLHSRRDAGSAPRFEAAIRCHSRRNPPRYRRGLRIAALHPRQESRGLRARLGGLLPGETRNRSLLGHRRAAHRAHGPRRQERRRSDR